MLQISQPKRNASMPRWCALVTAIMPSHKIDVKRKIYVFIIEKIDNASGHGRMPRGTPADGKPSVAREAAAAVKIHSKPNTGST
jgi:hypothetical protein